MSNSTPVSVTDVKSWVTILESLDKVGPDGLLVTFGSGSDHLFQLDFSLKTWILGEDSTDKSTVDLVTTPNGHPRRNTMKGNFPSVSAKAGVWQDLWQDVSSSEVPRPSWADMDKLVVSRNDIWIQAKQLLGANDQLALEVAQLKEKLAILTTENTAMVSAAAVKNVSFKVPTTDPNYDGAAPTGHVGGAAAYPTNVAPAPAPTVNSGYPNNQLGSYAVPGPGIGMHGGALLPASGAPSIQRPGPPTWNPQNAGLAPPQLSQDPSAFYQTLANAHSGQLPTSGGGGTLPPLPS